MSMQIVQTALINCQKKLEEEKKHNFLRTKRIHSISYVNLLQLNAHRVSIHLLELFAVQCSHNPSKFCDLFPFQFN